MPVPTRRGLLAAGLALASAPAWAQPAGAWPDRPLRLIIPVAPGGSLDIIGRVLAKRLTATLGQTVVAENMAGAGSNIAFEHVAKARPDGYTLLVGSDVLAINPAIFPKLGYDPARDFVAVAEAVRAPQVLVVRNGLEARDLPGFLALAKEAEGRLTLASQGNGSLGHLAGALLATASGARWTHVPYRGGGPAVVDLAGGHVDALLVTLPAAIEQIRGDRIRALAVTSATRHPALPDVPTVAESGFPGFEVVTWQGIVAPAGTPAPVVETLAAAITAALAEPEVAGQLRAQAFEVTGTGPGAFGELLRAEVKRWPEVVRAAGARVE
ncbi:tripartite tricarboxylate transporter substrate binding protein [Roseomonas sp. OT10]|uniref:Bug family tripartite tricarboxylate transporter substrate binding protein n=1 Tax=Roseomonas cutis TaxID=2897332 RepID=UPI001E35F3E5|nr:tripartite tricarboxylate transporter substrate binding protein [Roseomonas sp. OT10]UFN46985.1 tripartite tricarboxylate transporter substrate binding protein [Roseomonas sp. OT10]